jgi:hypothetical protein
MRALLVVGAALLASTMIAPAFAQDAGQSSDEEQVIVRGAREEQVRAFVSALTPPMSRRSKMSRWNGPLCLGVTGIQAAQAQAMNDRIGEIADSVGIPVQGPGCRPNVLIYFAADGNSFAASLARQSGLVSANGETGNSLGRDALRDFVETPRAVRWWHVSVMATDGFVFGRTNNGSALRGDIQEEVDPNAQSPQEEHDNAMNDRDAGQYTNAVRVRDVSRLRSAVNEQFDRVLIVVDGNQVRQTRLASIADYIAMVTLAQVNPDAEIATPSILSLFSSAEAKPEAITDWDLSYLQGLYRTSIDARNVGQQERQIVQSMMQSPN